jgi:hypothetical protein
LTEIPNLKGGEQNVFAKSNFANSHLRRTHHQCRPQRWPDIFQLSMPCMMMIRWLRTTRSGTARKGKNQNELVCLRERARETLVSVCKKEPAAENQPLLGHCNKPSLNQHISAEESGVFL